MGWSKGGLVMEAKPYALVILNKHRHQRCNFCLTRAEALRKCGACKKVKYCGTSCQRDDWKMHKQECPIMNRVPDLPTDSILLYIRLILLHLMDKSSVKFEATESPCLRSFNDLESHAEDIRRDKARYELFRTASDFVQAYASGVVDLPKEDVLLEIFGKMVINTFTVADEMLHDVAVAVYNSPSILDHRCRPNSVASFIGRSVMIRAIEDIADKDYAKVWLSYVDPLACVAERQQQLRDQYYFTCHCDMCQDTHLDLLMTSTDGSKDGDLDRVQRCMERVDTMTKDNDNPQDIVELSQKCLADVSLPSSNVYLVRLISKTYDAAINGEMWKEAAHLGRRNLQPLQQLNPSYTTSVGYALASLGKLLLFMGDVLEARQLLRQAFEWLYVCLGNHHFLLHNVKELIQQCDMELGTGRIT